jgi:hypothetical protein
VHINSTSQRMIQSVSSYSSTCQPLAAHITALSCQRQQCVHCPRAADAALLLPLLPLSLLLLLPLLLLLLLLLRHVHL